MPIFRNNNLFSIKKGPPTLSDKPQTNEDIVSVEYIIVIVRLELKGMEIKVKSHDMLNINNV